MNDFTVVRTENNENKLLSFIKENYPNIISDNEIKLDELRTVLGLPVDEKVNGYGLNFVGRNFAKAKYAQKTEKELRLNTALSKNIETTQNLVLKGDNLDSLKILKNHYSNKIKCIYIDPPYNTKSDEFVYPDKFDKEEAEVLGLANLSEDDFARMEFSFKTKKSHNGWLAFMYPRLLLARDLLSKDGVIFISIDDNEQANLKLLCDEIFGEENLKGQIVWRKTHTQTNIGDFARVKEYILVYSKSFNDAIFNRISLTNLDEYRYEDNKGKFRRKNLIDKTRGHYEYSIVNNEGKKIFGRWLKTEQEVLNLIKEDKVYWAGDTPYGKNYLSEMLDKGQIANDFIGIEYGTNQNSTMTLDKLLGGRYFDFPKPVELTKHFIKLSTNPDDIILDFFAGSGTTGEAVMQLNAEDGGYRKFILCQIDEPIKEDKPAYKFCRDNNLPPVISSITVERLRRAGKGLNYNFCNNSALFSKQSNQTHQSLDVGFKVFDCVKSPQLRIDANTGQISFPEIRTDALSRIYNMIFTVGLDSPTQVPEEIVKDCIYKIGTNYYITNSKNLNSDDYSKAIKNGKVFIDGWSTSLYGTLQNYKEEVKIVF